MASGRWRWDAALAGFGMVALLVAMATIGVLALGLVAVPPDLILFGVALATTYAALEISLAVLHARQ
jgi:hypothetical protein